MRSIGLLTFMMPAGFSNGAATMIGKSIGDERRNLAMQYYKVAQVAGLVISLFQILVLAVFKTPIISLFTSDEDVFAMIEAAWPILCLFTLFDTTQCMGISVLRGSGKQAKGAIFTFTAYWFFGIPLAYLCGIHLQWENMGLWIGPTVACAYLTICYSLLIACLDWEALFEEIRERKSRENEVR